MLLCHQGLGNLVEAKYPQYLVPLFAARRAEGRGGLPQLGGSC